jgi:hypothetical protein
MYNYNLQCFCGMGVGVRGREWIDSKKRMADRAIFCSVTVWHDVLKVFCSTYWCLQLTSLFLFNILSTCKYFQVPVDPQVLENPWVFDSQLQVTWWLKPTQIQEWHFEFEIPAGMDLGHPQVHSCSALLMLDKSNWHLPFWDRVAGEKNSNNLAQCRY